MGIGAALMVTAVMVKISIPAGFTLSLGMGLAIGVTGGELEFRSHKKEIYNRCLKR
jgi:hypothetical protein